MSDYNSFQENFAQFILSASGFRKVFAPAEGGLPADENPAPGISEEDITACAVIASVYGQLLSERGGKTIAVGMDARPTGPAIAAVLIKTLSDLGFKVLYSGVTAAPELMAWVKTNPGIDGFAYISASHNPIGHNGFKFGFEDGAVVGGELSKKFISAIIAAAVDEDVYSKYSSFESGSVLPDPSAAKAEAAEAYRNFSNEVISGLPAGTKQDTVLNEIRSAAASIGIIAELNGSARGVSIDRDYFSSFGIKSRFLNDVPGQVVHRIVPEGTSLDMCREALEKAHAEDSCFILGYVPDNDGDRGNIVYINDHTGCAEMLEAQEVFALSVKSELEFLRRSYHSVKAAVAVNGPTSMRIERIAAGYNAEVFRAEVGEANVVNLAAEKRNEGFEIRILGEGSNGGNITHPATVRDPLNTVFAIIKLLAFGGYSSVTEAVDSLPAFSSTSAYEPEAKMQIGSISHAELKANYESAFPSEFESIKFDLKKRFGITGWYEVNYEGTAARKGVGAQFRSGKQTGGLKIILTADEADIAFLWMRGSGTEPVFRVMTDLEGGNDEGMRYLLEWQRKMVSLAAGL